VSCTGLFHFAAWDFHANEVPEEDLARRKDNTAIFHPPLSVHPWEAVQKFKKSIIKAFIKAKKFEFFGDCRNHFPTSKL
jgi:hypothetical protein